MINAKSLSTFMAKRTLSTYLDRIESENDISDTLYMRADAAVGFLLDSEYGKGRLAAFFPMIDDNVRETLREGSNSAWKKIKEKELARNGKIVEEGPGFPTGGTYSIDLKDVSPKDFIDISGYNKLMYVMIAREGRDIDTRHLEIYFYDSERLADIDEEPYMIVDLSDYVSKFIDITIGYYDMDYTYSKEKYKEIGVIDIDEDTRFYITYANIRFDESRTPDDLTIYGYLLTK